ncbi:AhpC/TSA family protein [Curtobacterium sp. MCPF17_047]|uniref:peroxiredoxin-like family protein n=1 Tax=Curtobacterium sp. MCPF17_047 TaxID=2175654 RepID=UPI000DA8AA53|nr:peroxiredoxin-like family protein [Curtobacterium sp. MCPF17_047]PZF61914.1 AhpC/TSA family protein [Curtobacterium sp. MCPF17_047]
MPQQSLAEQVATFTDGFAAQIGRELSAVFDEEQAELRTAGVPSGAADVGTHVPDATLLTPSGASTSLAAELGGDPGVVVFYRGAWCPYCNLTLRTYQQDLLPELDARGVRLIAISPQTPEGSELAIANGELAFAVLSDPGNVLAAALGIVTAPSPSAREAHTSLGFDVADSNADDTAQIPFPSVFLVDGERVVRFADVHVDYTTRTEVSEILAAVTRVAG